MNQTEGLLSGKVWEDHHMKLKFTAKKRHDFHYGIIEKTINEKDSFEKAGKLSKWPGWDEVRRFGKHFRLKHHLKVLSEKVIDGVECQVFSFEMKFGELEKVEEIWTEPKAKYVRQEIALRALHIIYKKICHYLVENGEIQ